jgi:hypothetical protein
MPRPDLYDLAEKIIAARTLNVSRRRIEAAKRSSRTLVARIPEPVPVDINYDTLVVEEGVLHIYPDVYNRGTNRPARLRAELQGSNVDVSNLSDATIKRMLRKVTRRTQFVVETSSIAAGRALEDGRVLPLIPKAEAKTRKAERSKQWIPAYCFLCQSLAPIGTAGALARNERRRREQFSPAEATR